MTTNKQATYEAFAESCSPAQGAEPYQPDETTAREMEMEAVARREAPPNFVCDIDRWDATGEVPR